MSTVEIGRATFADRDVIFDIHVDSVTSQCGSHYEKPLVEEWFVGRIPHNYTGAITHGAIWIAKTGDVAVGFTDVFPALISMMFVRGKFSGRGIGSQLMEFATDRAADGEEGSKLTKQEATLNAQPFYEKFRFGKVSGSYIVRPSGFKLPTVLINHRS